MIFLGTNWKVYYMDNGLVCILRWIKSSVQVNAWRVDMIWYISFMLFEIGSKPVEGPSQQWNELVNWGKAKTMSLCKQVIYICLCSLQIILSKTFYIPFWMILILTKGFRKDIGEAILRFKNTVLWQHPFHRINSERVRWLYFMMFLNCRLFSVNVK